MSLTEKYSDAEDVLNNQNVHARENDFQTHEAEQMPQFLQLADHSDEVTNACQTSTASIEQQSDSPSHPHEIRYSCDICGKIFLFRCVLNKHKISHIKKEAPEGKTVCGKYSCNSCKKTFHFQSRLNAHKIRHSEERPEICPQCGKSFKIKLHLVRHLETHKSNFICKICAKRFQYKNELQRHMAFHLKPTSHVCDECEMAFEKRHHLTRHIKYRHTERQFICEVCEKRFCSKRELDKHVVIHSEIRPHVCGQCGKSFKRKDHLTCHMKRHTDYQYFIPELVENSSALETI